jgi:hypothetical protein
VSSIPALDAWVPMSVGALRALMEGADLRWWLSGGCALDLFVGHRIRHHGDIDISVARADWDAFRTHVGERLECFAARQGLLTPAPPVIPEAIHNVWTREVGSNSWQLQVNLEPVDDGIWRYRRDERVQRALSEVVRVDREVPYVRPSVQLLWKAKAPTSKDEVDKAAVFDLLDPFEREWLAASIAIAHADSPWAE